MGFSQFSKSASKIRLHQITLILKKSSYFLRLIDNKKLTRLGLSQVGKALGPNRCLVTNRRMGSNRLTGLSRIKIKQLADAGELPGFIRFSW